MRKSLDIKELRTIRVRRARHPTAFSLVELIVAMGILMVMLGLAGEVMSLTVRSTGQAKAVTQISQSLRVFERTLREDLSHVKAGKSLLLIQGNPINGYWSTSTKDADTNSDPADGFPERTELPRADILMFFTSRPASNYVQYEYPGTTAMAGKAVTSGVQQVVYGHANLVELDADGTLPGIYPDDYATFPTDPTAPWAIPADEWHLGRRVVHLLNLPGPPPEALPAWADAVAPDLLGDPRILQGETDVITRFDFEQWVLTPYSANAAIGGSPLFWPMIFNDPNQPPFARSALDPTPPPRFADRLGHYFLPHCASFKVEWTLDRKGDYVGGLLGDEKELYWIDPGADDPLGEFEYVIAESLDSIQVNNLETLLKSNRGDGGGYNLRQRFSGGGNVDINWHSHGFTPNTQANLVVFTAMRETNPFAGPVRTLPESVFPAALRITIDLVDDQKRLDRPTRHVMIIPVG